MALVTYNHIVKKETCEFGNLNPGDIFARSGLAFIKTTDHRAVRFYDGEMFHFSVHEDVEVVSYEFSVTPHYIDKEDK